MKPQPFALKILTVVSFLLLAVATWMVFFYAQLAKSGPAQRIFYFHVANAWVGMLGFLAAAVASIAYLRTHELKWDIVGVAAIEISLVFFFTVIVSGSIWAKAEWNTWWKWEDNRLVTAAIMEMIYFAYLLLRQGIEDPDRCARFGAVYALVGSLSVPITFMSIRWANALLHPLVISTVSDAVKAPFLETYEMKLTFFFSLFTFSLIFVVLLWHRIRLGRLAEKVEQMKLKVMQKYL